MPANRDKLGRPLRPTPRQGAGKGGRGIGKSGRARSSGRSGTGIVNPFNVSGKQARGRTLREQDEEPYAYDSNRIQLKIIKVVLALWVVLALGTAIADYHERQVLNKLNNQGFGHAPPKLLINNPDTNSLAIVEYMLAEGSSCEAEPVRCLAAADLAREFDGASGLVAQLFAGYLFLFIALAILIASFAFQANRNLLTLKSEGQHFSSVSAMLWLFVPMFNFYKGSRIFQEIWKGSDPEVDGAGEQWKSSAASGMVTLWWLALAVAILLGPRTMRWAWGSNLIDDRLSLSWGLIAMDLFLTAPAIFAYIAMNRIHERQEKKFEIVGPHMAVPPIKGFSLD